LGGRACPVIRPARVGRFLSVPPEGGCVSLPQSDWIITSAAIATVIWLVLAGFGGDLG